MTTTTPDLLSMQQALSASSPVPEDVTDRTQGLGGSDAAAVLGLSSYTTPLDVYLRAIGEGESSVDTYPMRRGTALEPILCDEYERQSGRATTPGVSMRHPKYPWMIAHTDGCVYPNMAEALTGRGSMGSRILEIKTAGLWAAQDWGEAGTDEVPEQHMLQAQHYLSVTGADVCDFCAEIAGRGVELFEVPRNKELIEMIEDIEAAFWNDHVLKRIAPEPTDLGEATKLWTRSTPKTTLEASDETLGVLSRWMTLRDDAKAVQARADAFKLDLQIVMGFTEALVAEGKTLLTWKNNKDGTRFDLAAFKVDHPDLFKAYQVTVPGARVFLTKKAAESL